VLDADNRLAKLEASRAKSFRLHRIAIKMLERGNVSNPDMDLDLRNPARSASNQFDLVAIRISHPRFILGSIATIGLHFVPCDEPGLCPFFAHGQDVRSRGDLNAEGISAERYQCDDGNNAGEHANQGEPPGVPGGHGGDQSSTEERKATRG